MKRRCAYGRQRAALAVLILPILSSIAAADVGSTGDLKQLSLEELMDIQVTSVARHPESILQAPASIQVITRDEIRNSGATSIPEALRLADNLQVAQKNAHDWGVSTRGFNAALSWS
jgi:iron complex outermembrane receptor protein